MATGLRGKRALVTGGGKRLGRAICEALGAHGMHVMVHYHQSREGAQATAHAIVTLGGEAELVPGDLSDRSTARGVVDQTLARLGGLDLLVLSSAVFQRVRYPELDDAAWDRTLGLNLTAPLIMAQQATCALRESRGSMVFITCSSATLPYRNYLPYVVSKGALRQLMRTLALELAPEIRVNAVAPGAVLLPEGTPTDKARQLAEPVPLGRIGKPENVSSAVVFLADNDFITGHEIVVDGGRSLAG